MAKQERSGLMASIHETAEGLHRAGVLSKRTLREFDELCLPGPATSAQANSAASVTRRSEPSGICTLLECFHRPDQPMGAWRKAAAGSLSQVVEPGGAEGPKLRRVGWTKPSKRLRAIRREAKRGTSLCPCLTRNWKLESASKAPQSTPSCRPFSGAGR